MCPFFLLLPCLHSRFGLSCLSLQRNDYGIDMLMAAALDMGESTPHFVISTEPSGDFHKAGKHCLYSVKGRGYIFQQMLENGNELELRISPDPDNGPPQIISGILGGAVERLKSNCYRPQTPVNCKRP